MLLENQFIHNFRYNLFTWRMSSNRVKTIGSRELLTNYSCEQIVTKLSILTRNWIEACLLCTGQKACPWCDTGIIGQLIIWLLYTKSTRSYSLTLFPPNVFSFSLLTYGLLIQFLPFSSQKQPPPLLSLSLRKGSYMTSLSLSRSILWPSGVNVKSNVQGMLSVPAHIHNFFRSCMRCLITFT